MSGDDTVTLSIRAEKDKLQFFVAGCVVEAKRK
jgi:hypothetical protein